MKKFLTMLFVFVLMNPSEILAEDNDESLRPFVQSHWSEQEAANVMLVWDLMTNLLMKRDYAYIEKVYGSHKYVQHSVTFEDGVNGLIAGVKGMEDKFPEFYFDIKSIHADGEYVIFHSHLTFEKASRGNDERGMIVVDKWRVVDKEIVEHWDSLQPLERRMSFIYLLLGNPQNHQNGIF